MEAQALGFSSWSFMGSLPTKAKLGVDNSFTIIHTSSAKRWEYAGWPRNVVTPLLREHLVVKSFMIFYLSFS